jgi:hypothetical protein
MASFISTLSLFILVSANGYFTLPVRDEQNLPLTYFPPSHGLGGETTERGVLLKYVPNDNETNVLLPVHPTDPSPFKLMGSEVPSTTERLPKENAAQGSPTFDNKDLLESSTFTTEPSRMDGRGLDESTTSTIEPTHKNEYILNVSPFIEVKTVPKQNNFYGRSFENTTQFEAGTDDEDSSDKREEKTNQQPMQIESTTLFMPSFPSTASAAAPQFDLSTKKYPGSLRDNQDDEGDKPIPTVPETSDDSLATTYPTPQLHQEGFKNLSNTPNDVLNLDQSNNYVVTGSASTARATTMENKDQEKPKPLNQGSKSS